MVSKTNGPYMKVAILVATGFTIAAILSGISGNWKMFWFYILSAAINIVVVI